MRTEEGREEDCRTALPRRGAGDRAAHKAVGSRATEAQTSPLASHLVPFFQNHDKDTISTIKRLFCPFPPFLYFLSPVHSPPPPLPNVLYHYLSYCLHTNMATTDMDAFSTEKSQQALTSIWPVLIKDLGLSA